MTRNFRTQKIKLIHKLKQKENKYKPLQVIEIVNSVEKTIR